MRPVAPRQHGHDDSAAPLPGPGAGTSPSSGVSFSRLVKALRRQKLAALVVFAGIVTAAFAAVQTVGPTYISDAKLFVRVGRESVTLDPTATTGETIDVYESRESEINSVLDMLDSRTVLEQVVDEMGVAALLDSPTGRPQADREAAVRMLGKAISPAHTKNSSVISLVCEARSPELARQTLTHFLSAFSAEYVKANRFGSSFEFFQSQAAHVRAELEQAQRRLSEAKNGLTLASIDDRLQELQDRHARIEHDLLATGTDWETTIARTAALRQRRGELTERSLANDLSTNSAFDNTREHLANLRISEQGLLAKFTPRHPDVQRVRDQIAVAERILGEYLSPGRRDAAGPVAAGPVRQELEFDLLRSEAEAESLQARLASLREQRLAVQDQLRRLNDQSARIQALERQVEARGRTLLAYEERLEEARFGRELGEQRLSNLNVIQPPSYVLKPVSPRKRLVLGLASVVAGIAAVGAALLRDFSKHGWPTGLGGLVELSNVEGPTATDLQWDHPCDGVEKVSQLVGQASR